MARKTNAKNLTVALFRVILPVLCILLPLPLAAEDPAPNLNSHENPFVEETSINSNRLWWVGSAHVAGYTGTLLVLNQMWYSDHPRSSFGFYNDLASWKQMDKTGHIMSAYHFSRLSHYTFRWAGLANNRAAMWGSISGNLFLTTIEILDGFSEEWGASWSDLAANTAGSLLFYSQQISWEEQKITLKYSYTSSGLPKYRPDLLGHNLGENLIKDYNGITAWASFNLHSLTHSDIFPPWLNIAVGYSATGLLGSYDNPAEYNGNPIPHFHRYRQLYLSPDIDFSRIPTRSHTLHQILTTLNFIKFPAPALEYNQQHGFVLHWVFF